jgi:hypothetical protein
MEEPVPAVPKTPLVNFQVKAYPEMVPKAGESLGSLPPFHPPYSPSPA